MERFARLLDALAFQYQRNGKLRLLTAYFREVPDPERGYALAALTGGLVFREAKPNMIRQLAMERVDPVLFALSYDFVGDLAETVALIWPAPEGAGEGAVPPLSEIVATLQTTAKAALPGVIARWLDALDSNGRWALIKLITGSLRVGVSARLAKQALADLGTRDVGEVEEVWPAQVPPYLPLFAWVSGEAERPPARMAAAFRPVMLAQAIEEAELPAFDPAAYAAEWKWDGIRVQAASEGGTRRLWSRTGEDVGPAFPDLLAGLDFEGCIDGELLVVRDGVVAPFADLQQRLNRKTVTRAMLTGFPVQIRAYDLLAEGDEDLRPLPFIERRARLEKFLARVRLPHLDLSPRVPFATWEELAAARAASHLPGVEGMMLKRLDSAYVGGRPKGPWFKWKRDPHLVDAVMMYAQRGHGKRSSFYSDYTFGVWRGDELVPVGKAYFGFTDEELAQLDRWVRNHTTGRFGPVREVDKALVLEVAFEGLQRSTRHRSGIAMRFPRISRIRWDKPAGEADRIEALEKLLAG
ncbi:cisplatin damage response ATP-dependent DNA ligase [Zavarzinia sp. CC-PAN008]|uniref:cisplatin damage response ATP-dependent DNA ligase n=1 Tax=Zavarzinia sp. CC-PAN008 TaxID=3243332 RepID=UPI003F748B2E